jgi:DNA mismatch repair protein MutS
MSVTPLRRQYVRVKQNYAESIVLFRLGDFYETFDDDARVASRELDIVLTSREMGKGHKVPMAGIPVHALDGYLARFIKRGYKVAICEQLSPPGKGLVDRDVVRVVTPGTVVETNLLEARANNYLVSLIVEGSEAGIAYVDISTGEFAVTQLPAEGVSCELERLQPSEIILPASSEEYGGVSATVSRLDDYWCDREVAQDVLLEHFAVATLEGYGCAQLPLAIRAAGSGMATYSTDSFMTLDGQTIRNLELFLGGRGVDSSNSLLSVLDLTRTAMGARLLRSFLAHPLLDIAELEQRQEAIDWFYGDSLVRGEVTSALSDVADLERLISRVRAGRVLSRELVTLSTSLGVIPGLREKLGSDNLGWLVMELKPCPDVVNLIAHSIADEPGDLDHGGVIREGFSPELDKLRHDVQEAKAYLAGLEQREKQRTGIKSLKVGYNRVFGYYIEISRANINLAPADYIRKQTLAEAERFFTPELKEYESLILNSQEKMISLESDLFRQVCQQVAASGDQVLSTARAIAKVDVFSSLAEVAVKRRYVRPKLTSGNAIDIKGGRHPVVESSLGMDGFVPNDTYLSNEDFQLIVLTGPNMSGKSTYLKQVAILVLLAQTGSFIPADSATIGIVDRIFTRIGAQEDLAAGQSTFMVEMTETANILHNATSRSLIILDEIGRGTSTYDGLSIAWAVVEFMHNYPRLGAKTLFATHYHELVEMAGILPRVKNYNVAVVEEGDKVVFLHKIIPGGADRSYGIHVAQMAGLPRAVIERASEVLLDLEDRHTVSKVKISRGKQVQQLPLFPQGLQIRDEISKMDIDSMSPLDAITRLYELKRMAERE